MELRRWGVAAGILLAITTAADARPKRSRHGRTKPTKVQRKNAKSPKPKPTDAAADAAKPADAPTPAPDAPPKPAVEPPAPAAPQPIQKGPRTIIVEVALHKTPGERAPTIVKLPKGTVVEVERAEGRWLRVRAGKFVGYVTRTTVSGGDATEEDAAGGWSAQRRAGQSSVPGTGLFVRVRAETAALRAEPRTDAASLAPVARDAKLVVIDGPRTAGWLRARDDHGNEGWIERSLVVDGAAAAALPAATARTEVATAAGRTGGSAREPARWLVRADAGIGLRMVGMDFTSNGAGGLANYLVTADAAAADVAVDAVTRLSRRLLVGADGRLQVSRSSPGIDYPGPSGPSGEIPFSTFGSDVGVRAGFSARETFELAARGGLHYDAFLAHDVDNAGLLPRERLLGGTVGIRANVAPPSSRVTVSGRFDALVIGSRAQTPGLEYGESSTARAFWGGVTLRVQVTRYFAAMGAYDFSRASTQWSGMSVRDPGVTEAKRVDSSQLVQIGLSTDL